MPSEKTLDEILVDSAYDGYFMGRIVSVVNAPEEVVLPALKILAGAKGIAIGWQKYGMAYRFVLVSRDPKIDAGVIARTIGGGDGTREVSTFTAGKLLLKG